MVEFLTNFINIREKTYNRLTRLSCLWLQLQGHAPQSEKYFWQSKQIHLCKLIYKLVRMNYSITGEN